MSYWYDRMADAQNRLTNKSIRQTEKQLKKYYQAAMEKTIADFEATYQKILDSVANGREPTPADLYKLDKYWQSQAQLKAQLQKLGDKQINLLSKEFEENWRKIYNSIAIPGSDTFNTVDDSLVQQMINSIWVADGKSWSSRIWENTERLAAELNEGLIHCVATGKKPAELKKTLQERFGVSYSSADSLVRTEMAHIQTEAAKKRYEDAGITEVEVYAPKDERQCDVCGKLHGKKFSAFGPMPVPAHPRCRCCIIPILDSLTLDKSFVNINKDEYIDKPSSEIPGDAQSVRRWYYFNVHNLPMKIDRTLPLKEQAEQACELRNNLKKEARSIMSSREDAEMLDGLYPPPTVEELVKKKMQKYQLTREQALNDILRTCGITNSDFDKEFMVQGGQKK